MNTLYTFKQSQQHGLFYTLVLFLFLMVWALGQVWYLFLGIPLLIGFFRDYRITETHTLAGNGTVAIATIERLVVKGRKVTAYYRPVASEKRSFKHYYLKTPQEFVNALVEINPSIEVCMAQ